MDFYVIPPVNELKLMHNGDRYFCLAQLYKKHSHYREFFKEQVKLGRWVTLDNGAGDHDIVTPHELFEIMLDLQPSEVIPPDFLFDGIKTIRELELFYTAMKLSADADKVHNVQILACPQGRNKQEWMFVYEYMLMHPGVHTLGLSKIAVPRAFMNATGDKMIKEARNLCYDILKENNLIKKPLHLLGMGSPKEFAHYQDDPFIRSSDSCNSVWSAINNQSWKDGEFDRTPTPKDYFTRYVSEEAKRLALENIIWFRKELLGSKRVVSS